MPTLFDPAAEAPLRARLDRLTPDTPARWGTLDAPRMLAHLRDGVAVALAETPVERPRGPLTWWPVRRLIIDVLPWPKGRIPTTREMLLTSPADFARDREAVKEITARAIARFRAGDGPWGVHPAFGPLSAAEWGRLGWKHMDHHLRQFGV